MIAPLRLLLLLLPVFYMSEISSPPSKLPRILVFSKTAGFRHSSIEPGKQAILQLARENGFIADTTEDASLFTVKNLRRYKAVVFLSTTGDVLNEAQQAAFERYIQKGGGYAGIHAATDTEYGWPWYGKLAGAYFTNHPAQQEATLRVVDPSHLSTAHLPATWVRKDEWYNFKEIAPDLHVLITIDESSYTGGQNGTMHPMAWYHSYDGGRAWYTALGHTEASYSDPLFLQHLLGGIRYAMGVKK